MRWRKGEEELREGNMCKTRYEGKCEAMKDGRVKGERRKGERKQHGTRKKDEMKKNRRKS